MTRRKNRLLVPEAREALDRLKCELLQNMGGHGESRVDCEKEPDAVKYSVASQLNVPLRRGDNGELTAREAGKVGGAMGGPMVRRLVELAKEQMKSEGKQ
jgi:hypothetical protein